ncbi:MAG: PEP-CTERM sorting domain-containing protein [Chthoniobacteraceae bacterium]
MKTALSFPGLGAFFFLLLTLLSSDASAQIIYAGGDYTQDFNSLQDSAIYTNYTTMPTGWQVSHGSYVWTNGSTGYSANYGTYVFASVAGALDKAIGLVLGTTGAASITADFVNNTGVTISSFTLSYYEEEWVKGAVTGSDQVTTFQYALNPGSAISDPYVNFSALDMHSINDGDGVSAPLDGNATANRQFITATVSGLNWLPGEDLALRWTGNAYSFSTSHAMALDDLTFTTPVAAPEPGTVCLAFLGLLFGFTLRRRVSV